MWKKSFDTAQLTSGGICELKEYHICRKSFLKLPKSQHFRDIYDSRNVEYFYGGFMTKHNRRYKDSVFVDLFGEDKTAKVNFLSLYNALHGTGLDASQRLSLSVSNK